MQAVMEIVVSVIAALTMAVLAAFGADLGPSRRDDAPVERVVARSPKAKPVTTPKATVDCPEARAAASDIA